MIAIFAILALTSSISRMKKLGIVLVMSVVGISLVVNFSSVYSIGERMSAATDCTADSSGFGYETCLEKDELAAGGLLGRGIRSPAENNKSVYTISFLNKSSLLSVVARQHGMVGFVAVVATFLVLSWLLLRRQIHFRERKADPLGLACALYIVVPLCCSAIQALHVPILLPRFYVPFMGDNFYFVYFVALAVALSNVDTSLRDAHLRGPSYFRVFVARQLGYLSNQLLPEQKS